MTVLLASGFVIGNDWFIHRLPPSNVAIFHSETTGGDEQRLIVFLTGTQSSGRQLSVDLVPYWQTFGDVEVVEYNQVNFEASTVVDAVIDSSAKYSRLTLIGASLGGLLSYDITAELKRQQSSIKIDWILADAPTGRVDLIDQTWGPQLSKVPFGPFSNWLFTDAVHAGLYHPPPIGELEPNINMSALDELHKTASNWPLSGWSQQGDYIVSHPKLKPFDVRGTQAVILQSSNDGVVTREAAMHWSEVFDILPLVIQVHSMHIEFLGFPLAWQNGFESALARLG